MGPIIGLSASVTAETIRTRELSAAEVTEAHIDSGGDAGVFGQPYFGEVDVGEDQPDLGLEHGRECPERLAQVEQHVVGFGR